jgi:electron transfer flavoprotein beta subunit
MSLPPAIGVCWKVVGLRPDVDPLSGEVHAGRDGFGVSGADEAALEWALRLGAGWGCQVVVVAGGDSRCDTALRSALAAGASRALRVPMVPDLPSPVVAGRLALVLRAVRALGVVCGDASLDRGSGSVPAFLAAELRAAQALGLVGLGLEPGDRTLLVDRRLDRGRRERLRVREPFVVSVEAGTARLRRASLPALLATGRSEIEVVEAPSAVEAGVDGVVPTGSEAGALDETDKAALGGSSHVRRGDLVPSGVKVVGIEPFRPRAKVVAPPPATLGPRERVLALTGAMRGRQPPRTLTLGPDEAAAALLEALSDWGELP